MWHLKAIVIPVVVGALGLIKKKTEDHIKRIPGNPCLQELQEIVLNVTAHLLRLCNIHVTEYTVLTQPEDQHYCSATVIKCMKLHLPLP